MFQLDARIRGDHRTAVKTRPGISEEHARPGRWRKRPAFAGFLQAKVRFGKTPKPTPEKGVVPGALRDIRA